MNIHRIVLINGCFDMLHKGHQYFLICARQFGWPMIGLNTDESIRKLKGEGRPLQPYNERKHALEKCGFIYIYPFDGNIEKLIQELKPNLIARGWDQTITEYEKEYHIVIIPRFGEISTTSELKKK